MAPETDITIREAEDEWDASWAGTKRAQLKAALAATPDQRLAWLEEAMRLAHAAGALPVKSGGQIEPQPSRDD